MNDHDIPQKLPDRPRTFDTPTIRTAIEGALVRRGHEPVTRRTMFWAGRRQDVIVG